MIYKCLLTWPEAPGAVCGAWGRAPESRGLSRRGALGGTGPPEANGAPPPPWRLVLSAESPSRCKKFAKKNLHEIQPPTNQNNKLVVCLHKQVVYQKAETFPGLIRTFWYKCFAQNQTTKTFENMPTNMSQKHQPDTQRLSCLQT